MRLQDIISAGGRCVYAGEMRRELIPLSVYTQQGGSVTGGTVADQVSAGTRGTTFHGPRGFLTGSSGAGLKFGRGVR